MHFNRTETKQATFYDENGNAQGQVMMMHQRAPFPYTVVQELNAHALELPYGKVNCFRSSCS